MAYLNDRVLDNGLTVLDTEVTHLYICSAAPTSYAQATTTYALGNKAAPSVGAPEAATPTGRKVVVAAFADGAITSAGTATHYALVDTTNSRLLAAAPLDTPRAFSMGDAFKVATGWSIRLPGAV